MFFVAGEPRFVNLVRLADMDPIVVPFYSPRGKL